LGIERQVAHLYLSPVLRAGLLVAALLALLLVAPASDARRAPTSDEKKELADAASLDPACTSGFISTVDRRFGSVVGIRRAGCGVITGTFAVRRTTVGFEVVGAVPVEIGAACPKNVPRAAALDLQLCRPAKTYLLCRPANSSTTDGDRVLSEKPSRCSTLGPGDTRLEGVNLAKLKWRGWGGKSARSRGISRGFSKPFKRTTIRVRAYRLRRCPAGDLIYTRLATRVRGKSQTFGFPASCTDSGVNDPGSLN
jgi:hypothetical protein